MVFRYSVAKGYSSRDVTQDYKGMLKTGNSLLCNLYGSRSVRFGLNFYILVISSFTLKKARFVEPFLNVLSHLIEHAD